MEVQVITIATLSGVKPSKTPEMVPNKATSISNVRKAKNSNSSGCSLTNSPYQYFVNNPFRTYNNPFRTVKKIIPSFAFTGCTTILSVSKSDLFT